MPYSIYLVEDEMNLNQVLTAYLDQEGWNVTSFRDGSAARTHIEDTPHLWILDIMLPGVDGYQLLKEIKAFCRKTPVIFISARDADLDRVLGLEMGSDDYLAKPFLPRELVVRAKKLLERVYGQGSPQSNYIYGHYSIFEEQRLVLDGNTPIQLTSKEFDILLLFIKNIGRAFGREDILYKVWGKDYFGSDRVVDDLVRRLRKKVPDFKLETIYGYGYRLVESDEK
ncbi:response regulator transcription factor [Bacillus sp. REN3]|uniref:response regulator transcription factor n=1 Tax=Bacillus sp. REN3 TaxID=2802440 RepID=UPI001AEDF21A|nr:response regulator transcription factor [Bacillus sp. REN3]